MHGEHKKSTASNICVYSVQLLFLCCDYKEDKDRHATHYFELHCVYISFISGYCIFPKFLSLFSSDHSPSLFVGFQVFLLVFLLTYICVLLLVSFLVFFLVTLLVLFPGLASWLFLVYFGESSPIFSLMRAGEQPTARSHNIIKKLNTWSISAMNYMLCYTGIMSRSE